MAVVQRTAQSVWMWNSSWDLFRENQCCVCKSTSPCAYNHTDLWKETQVVQPASGLGDGTKKTYFILFEFRTFPCISWELLESHEPFPKIFPPWACSLPCCLIPSIPFLSLPTVSMSTCPNQIHIETSPLSLKCWSLGASWGGGTGFLLEWLLVKFLFPYCSKEDVHCLSKILQTSKIMDKPPHLVPFQVCNPKCSS